MNTRTNDTTLRIKIVQSLTTQEFCIQNDIIWRENNLAKKRIRDLHKTAVEHRIERAKNGLFRKEDALLRYIALGNERVPSKIRSRLIEVLSGSEEDLLFRYASDTGAFRFPPDTETFEVSCIDENNGRLMGVIGLGYPVFSIRARANWIGWTPSARAERLRNVMDAFVLGTVHPYGVLLCGKWSQCSSQAMWGAPPSRENTAQRVPSSNKGITVAVLRYSRLLPPSDALLSTTEDGSGKDYCIGAQASPEGQAIFTSRMVCIAPLRSLPASTARRRQSRNRGEWDSSITEK